MKSDKPCSESERSVTAEADEVVGHINGFKADRSNVSGQTGANVEGTDNSVPGKCHGSSTCVRGERHSQRFLAISVQLNCFPLGTFEIQ